jgi:tetratricopeptide (TPR) repeat protein
VSVQARASSVSFKGQDATLRTIASTLGVGRLINGSLRRQGQMLDVSVEILDDEGFAVRPPLRFSRPDTQLLALQQEIAQQVGNLLAPRASATSDATQTLPTAASESANMLIVFGSHLEHEVKDELAVDEDKLRNAIDFYRQAIRADPASISAYSRLAGALLYLGDVDAAKAPLEKLIDLAQAKNAGTKPAELSEAYYTLALYRLRTRSPGVDDAFEEAIRFNPSNADALGAYAQWLMTHIYVAAANQTRIDGYFREAIRLDRQSLSRYADYAEYLGTPPSDMSDLRELGREIERRFPDARGYLKLARVYELSGDLDVGIAWGLRAYRRLQEDAETRSDSTSSRLQLQEDARGQLAELYARIGEFDKATEFEPKPGVGQLFFRRRYEDLVTVAQEAAIERPDDARVYVLLAFAYNATGDFKNAQSLLERSLGFPRAELYSGQDLEVLPEAIYRDALQARGVDEEFVRKEADGFVADFDRGMRKGFDHTWYMNVYLACAQAQLGRVADALDSLDRVKNAEGLVWSPLVEDSPCFKRVENEPRYLALLEHLDERQRALRERLPATLREFGVENVHP